MTAPDADGLSPGKQRQIEELFLALPEPLPERREALQRLRSCFQSQLAHAVQEALNKHLLSLPHDHPDDKRSVASYVNELLRDLDLSIRADTGDPAILIAQDHSETRCAYRLRAKDADGHTYSAGYYRDKPPVLTLMPARSPVNSWTRRRGKVDGRGGESEITP